MGSAVAKILLIDDNPQSVKDALEMYGYEVNIAQDGLCALNILNKECDYDLILLDVMMPKLDGWETLKAIRNKKETKTIPVIMLSAVDADNKQISGLKFGADDYIVKPFILPNLLARIEALLRRVQWQKEDEKTQKFSFKSSKEITPLTLREKEILALLSKGALNKEIADKLFVREVTVKTHLNSIYRKLGVENRVQAVLLSMQADLIN